MSVLARGLREVQSECVAHGRSRISFVAILLLISVAGGLALARGFWSGCWLLAVLTGFSVLNRETGLLLPLCVLAVEPHNLRMAAVNLWAFFGVGWVLAAVGFRRAPGFVRVVSCVAVAPRLST